MYVAEIQSIKDNAIYIMLVQAAPCCIKVRDSKLKAENVLKPPQKPTIQKRRVGAVIICLKSANPTARPKRKHANTLISKVLKGKESETKELIQRAKK